MPHRCAATLHPLKKRHPQAQLPFCCPGGGGVTDGLEVMETGLGSLESKKSIEEKSQKTSLGSSRLVQARLSSFRIV